MSQEIELEGVKFPAADGEATPESIKQAVRELMRQLQEGQGKLEQLSQRVTELEEKQSKNSKNSSQPPSKDGFGSIGGEVSKAGSRRRKPLKFKVIEGKGERELYEPEACRAVYEVKAEVCPQCGEQLSGVDEHPYRHQVVDVPKVKPDVVEYRLHQLECEHCGTKTRAKLPEGVSGRCTACGWQDG